MKLNLVMIIFIAVQIFFTDMCKADVDHPLSNVKRKTFDKAMTFSLSEENWIPFYAGGSIGIPLNFTNVEENIFGSVSAGFYFTKSKASSVFVEGGHFERKITYFSAGVSIAVLNVKNNLITPELSIGLFGGGSGHPSGGITLIGGIKYLHRFNNTFGVTSAIKFPMVSQRSVFFTLGFQLN